MQLRCGSRLRYLRRAPDKLLAVSDGGGDVKNVQGGSEQLAVMCARVRTMSSFPTGDTLCTVDSGRPTSLCKSLCGRRNKLSRLVVLRVLANLICASMRVRGCVPCVSHVGASQATEYEACRVFTPIFGYSSGLFL